MERWRAGGVWIIKIAFIAVATLLAMWNVAMAVAFVSATILALLYGKADSLIEVSFGPLKAKLQRDITEAERLMEKLRALAAAQGRAAIAASAHTGRFATDDDWIFQSAKRVESALRDLDVSEAKLIEARSELVTLTIRDAAMIALGSSYVPTKLGDAAHAPWKEIREVRPYPLPDQIERWLSEWGALSPQHQQRINDMRWMIEHKDVQNSEMYLRAHTPIGDTGLEPYPGKSPR